MTPDQIQTLINSMMGEYFWWFIGVAAALFFKGMVENTVSGLTFLFGNDYNVDDVVYIGGTKKARIVRQTMTKTVFYICDTRRRLVIPNVQLHGLRIEKVLPGEPERTENVQD